MILKKSKKFDSNSNAQFLWGGNQFFENLFLAIENARHEIIVQVYILKEDHTGKALLHLLYKAADRGVKVNLLLDSFGSDLSAETIQIIREKGIVFRYFSPIINFFNFRIGRRLHHKIIVIDKELAWVGGINFSDNYSGFGNSLPWFDFALRIEGNEVQKIRQYCLNVLTKKIIRVNLSKPKKVAISNLLLRFTVNDRIRGLNQITTSYYNAFRQAEKEIIIVASYFLPSFKLMNILKSAAKRGVKIKVYLSQNSDIQLIKNASSYLYTWFFKHKIEIEEYQPSIIHGKLALVDGEWLTLGSYNLNHLSEYGSLEANIELYNKTFVSGLKNKIEEKFMGNTEIISIETYQKKYGFFKRIRLGFDYFLARFLMRSVFVLVDKSKGV